MNILNILIVYCAISWWCFAVKMWRELPEVMEEIGPVAPKQEAIVRVLVAVGLTFLVVIAPILMFYEIYHYCAVKWRKWKSIRTLNRLQKMLKKVSKKHDMSEAVDVTDKLKVAINNHFDKML